MTETPASLPRPRRLAYGPDASQFGDLYLPAGDRRPGTVVLIHGGFWRARLSLEIIEAVARDLAGRGWVTWSVEYRRVGNGGGYPATLFDVAAAVDHLATLAAPPGGGGETGSDLGIDLDRVVAVGHSAGGQLAVWAAGRGRSVPAGTGPGPAAGQQGWGEDLDPEPPGRDPKVAITGVLSLAGVLNLAAAAAEDLGNGATLAFMDGDAERRPARYAVADPLTQVPLAVPVRCVHGRGDFNVPFEQSVAYVEAAKAAGGDAELVEIEGDHFVVVAPDSAAWPVILGALEELTGA